MRFNANQLFVIVLLAVLAGLSFWLERAVAPIETVQDGKLRHDPDSMAENFVVRLFDERGQVKYRLTAPYMEHFPDDDTTIVKSPLLKNYRPGAPELTLSGENAKVSSEGETVYLWGNVKGVRAATKDRSEMVATSPYLTARPNDGIAFTDSPVEITEGKSWVKGVGMYLDNNASTIELKSQVTGLTYPRRANQ